MTGTDRSSRSRVRFRKMGGGGRRGVEDVVGFERGAAPEVHEQEEAVEDALDRLHGVHVGGEAPGRLGGPEGQQPLDRQAAQRVTGAERPGGAEGPGGLGEDPVGVHVARVGELAVALGVPGPEAERVLPDSVDTDRLRRDAGEGEALVERGGDVGQELEPRRHIVPGDDDRPVEPRRVARPLHQHPGAECLGRGDLNRPAAVLAERCGRVVAEGPAGQEELLLDVADGGQVVHRRGEGPAVRATRDRPGDDERFDAPRRAHVPVKWAARRSRKLRPASRTSSGARRA